MGQIRIQLNQGLNRTLSQELEHHWDEKLLPSEHNPRPLGPSDLEKKGLLSNADYREANHQFSLFCNLHMLNELEALRSAAAPRVQNPIIEIWGLGILRGLDWIPTAISAGFTLRVRDISNVAIENVRMVFRAEIEEGKIEIIAGEIEETLELDEINPRRTVAYYCSQFFQVLDQEKMRRVLGRLASTLRRWPKGINPKPRIYIVHPFLKDNVVPRVWKGVQLPSVLWGDTTPYTEIELRGALESRLNGRGAAIKVHGTGFFCHQCYSFGSATLVDH